jgi:glycosyltransferase involved in cell wall biosynthesis
MTVLMVGAYPPPHGGLQTNLVAIREYLRERGHRCPVINISRHRRAPADDVYYPHSALGLLRLLWTLRYDIIHLHFGGNLTPRLLGLCLAATLAPKSKCVLTFHSGGYATSPAGRTASPWTIRGAVFRRLDRVITVNEEIFRLFLRFGVPRDRIRLIYPFSVPRNRAAGFPQEMERFFQAHTPVLLSVGLLEPEYDLPLQIDALGEIRRDHPNAGLILIGSGSLENALRDQIRAQRWRDHILLCGDVPHPVTLHAITRCDVLLRTTLYDGDAISIREALYLGTPVVATDNQMRPPGVRLIPISDAGALRRAVTEALGEKTNQERLSGGEENLQAVLALYEELLSDQGETPGN